MDNLLNPAKLKILGKYLCAVLLIHILLFSVRDETYFNIMPKFTQGIFNSESQEKTFNCSKKFQYNGTQDLLEHIYTPTYTCKNLVKVGEGLFAQHVKKVAVPGSAYKDGTKYMCMDDWLHLNKSDCLVYSFGISNKWNFDDDIAAYGCEVHAFDPTIGLQSHKRSAKITFHNLGIAARNGFMIIEKKVSNVARLEKIIQMLGHVNRKIDYLKVDVEGSEIPVFTNVFKNNYQILTKYVMQIGMEIHLTTFASSVVDENHTKKHWDLLQKFNCFGFKLVHNDPNVSGIQIAFDSMFFARSFLLLVFLGSLETAFGQGFYSTRYGKRNNDASSTNTGYENEGQSGFYANRYGRSSILPEIKIRSSRFIGGSRYGKRSAVTNAEGDLPHSIDGDTFDCVMVNSPSLYRCLRKSFQPPEEAIN